MRFWDSSAVVPLLVGEASSRRVLVAYEEDTDIVAWWATEVECVSTLARLERDGRLTPTAIGDGLRRLDGLTKAWHAVQPVPAVRSAAIRVLRVHPLRAADALQLGAAIVVSEGHRVERSPLVTLDDRLALAAEREGLAIVTPENRVVSLQLGPNSPVAAGQQCEPRKKPAEPRRGSIEPSSGPDHRWPAAGPTDDPRLVACGWAGPAPGPGLPWAGPPPGPGLRLGFRFRHPSMWCALGCVLAGLAGFDGQLTVQTRRTEHASWPKRGH